MKYLLTWTCEHCRRSFKTYLVTGDTWPHLCDECNTKVIEAVPHRPTTIKPPEGPGKLARREGQRRGQIEGVQAHGNPR